MTKQFPPEMRRPIEAPFGRNVGPQVRAMLEWVAEKMEQEAKAAVPPAPSNVEPEPAVESEPVVEPEPESLPEPGPSWSPSQGVHDAEE